MNENKSARQIIEEVCEDICMNYCKWPDLWKPEEHDGAELCDSEHCQNCALERLN